MKSTTSLTFTSVLSEHIELEQLFEKHQRALLSRDIATSIATIQAFEQALQQHITFEDDVLLPLYASKGAEVEGGTLPIFHAEHRKLREMTADLVRRSSALEATTDLLGAILEILDEEALFKGLFSHHSLREENLLFPRLEACTTEREREKALRQAG
jgi:hemerythrin-like domain-containing protein